MKCMDCPHFRIQQEPIRAIGGGYWDLGLAKCLKHDLIVDFSNHGKLKKLECVRPEDESNELPKIDKVIKALEACIWLDDCAGHACPYWDYDGDVGCRTQMEMDALELLKRRDEK